MNTGDGEQEVGSGRVYMEDWVKKRVRERVAFHGSVENAAEALDIDLVFLLYFYGYGCGRDNPRGAEVLVKLAVDIDEAFELWQAYYPEYAASWPKAAESMRFNRTEYLAYELLYRDNRYCYICLYAKRKGGIPKRYIQKKWGIRGLEIARLLERLTILMDAGRSYRYDFSERMFQRWFFPYLSEGLVAVHEGREFDFLEQSIRGVEELKQLRDSLADRSGTH